MVTLTIVLRVLCSSCPYSKVGVARTVSNSHVIVLCSIQLVLSKSGVLRTVNGASPLHTYLLIYLPIKGPPKLYDIW